MKKEDDRRYIVALARGLNLLSAFTPERPRMTLAEISKVTGLPKSTVVRILFTLEAMGYISGSQSTGAYFPGPKLMSLGLSVLTSMDLVTLATPYAEKLAQNTGRIVNIGVLDDLSVLYCVRVGTVQVFDLNIRAGSRIPLHNTAMGHALIAFSKPDVREDLLRRLSEDLKTRTIAEQIRSDVATIQKNGFAIGDRKFSLGVRAVAVPIWQRGNELAAAMNVAGPADSITVGEMIQDIVPQLLDAARLISLSLGANLDGTTNLPRAFSNI